MKVKNKYIGMFVCMIFTCCVMAFVGDSRVHATPPVRYCNITTVATQGVANVDVFVKTGDDYDKLEAPMIVLSGSTLKVNATAADGCSISSITANGTEVGNDKDFIVEENTTISVTAKAVHKLTVQVDSEGINANITVSIGENQSSIVDGTGSFNVVEGALVKLTAVQVAGYTVKWTGCSEGAENGNEYSFTMPGQDVTCTATYEAASDPVVPPEIHSLIVQVEPDTIGTDMITCSVGGSTTEEENTVYWNVEPNEEVTLAADAYVGKENKQYEFVGWFNGDEQITEGVTYEDETYKLAVEMTNRDVTYTAKYEEVCKIRAAVYNQCVNEITIDLPSGEQISVADEEGQQFFVPKGSNLSVSAEKKTGCDYSIVVVDDFGKTIARSVVNDSIQINVNDNIYIVAVAMCTVQLEVDPTGIADVKVALMVEFDGGGYVLNVPDEGVPVGSILKVCATPEEGYEINSIDVQPEAAVCNNCFEVQGDTTITVAAQIKKYTLTLQADPAGISVWLTYDGYSKMSDFIKEDISYDVEVVLSAFKTKNKDGKLYEFLGWFLPNGKLISLGTYNDQTGMYEYTFIMRANATYVARYKESGKHTVSFVTDDQVIKVADTGSFIADNIPEVLTRYGMEFVCWTLGKDTYDDTERAKLVEAIQGATEDIRVIVTYKNIENVGTVKVFKNDTDHQIGTTDAYAESQWVTFKVEAKGSGADELMKVGSEWHLKTIDADYFSHWELDEVIISKSKTVRFMVAQNCNLIAVFFKPKGDVRIALSRAAYEQVDTDGTISYNLRLEAELSGISSSDNIESVYFDVEGEVYSCDLDPDGKGTYIAIAPSVTLNEIYQVQPTIVLANKSKIVGETISLAPESGYDIRETACASIVKVEGLVFTAYITVPEGGTIDRAGVIAAVVDSGAEIAPLDFNSADYVKNYEKAVGKSGPVQVYYTWTKLDLEQGKKIYVRPYVMYTKGGEHHTVVGWRVKYPEN